MGYFRKQMGISQSIICYFICVPLQAEEIWAGNARLYDDRNQYQVTCRLTKEKNVEPFFGEDSVKCFYVCTDKEEMVVNTHSDFACEKQIQVPRGDKRDWRGKGNIYTPQKTR